MDNLRIVTLNVRGLRGNKRYSIYNWFKDNKFDICLVQESYCTKEFASEMKKGRNGELIHSYSNSEHSRGVCILFRKNLQYKIFLSTHCDKDGRLLIVNIDLNGVKYSICNEYYPNNISDRIKFLSHIVTFVRTRALSKYNLCIGGDFNCVSTLIDKASGNLDKSSCVLDKVKNDLKLVDIWRSIHPNQKEFSFIDHTKKSHDSRIDLWLVPKSTVQHVKSCTIVQAPTPDHKAISLDIKFCNKERGKGYWKLNNSVLNDDEYCFGSYILVAYIE